jgi:replication factor C small subunit
MIKNHKLYVEKYRPKTLDNFVGSDILKQTIQKFLDQNDITNLTLYGPPGCGKTTLAKLIVNNLNCDYLLINASDERGIETIREKVQGFASTASFKPLKVVILDEADYITIQGQAALRNVIETYSMSTRFILTCNFIERIIDPLQSRCQVLKIVPPSKGEVAKHVVVVLEKEKTEYDLDSIKLVVNQFYPDLRKILNTCQLSTHENKLVIDKSLLITSNYIDKVIEVLKSPTATSWKTIRQIIADSNINEYDELYRSLYDRVEEYSKGNDGELIVILAELQYQSNFRIDKEINILSAISQILKITLKKKVI